MSGRNTEEVYTSQLAEREFRRVFLLGVKDIQEEELRDIFGAFGTLIEVKKTYDATGFDRGIAYLSYSKTSEAFLAIEEGSGVAPKSHPDRSIKVNLSKNAKDAPKENETNFDRLFLRVKPSDTEKELRDEFSKFGEVSQVKILRHKLTNESRGMAFVKFERNSAAALALEECDSSYHATFAKSRNTQEQQGRLGPQPPMGLGNGVQHMGQRFGASGGGGGFPGGLSGAAPPMAFGNRGVPTAPMALLRTPARASLSGEDPFDDFNMAPAPTPRGPRQMIEQSSSFTGTETPSVVAVRGCSGMTEHQVFRLSDIVPGLKMCKLDSSAGKAFITYENSACANYACEKLNKLEYPPGMLQCSLQSSLPVPTGVLGVSEQLKMSLNNLTQGNADIETLVGTLQMATEALQSAGLSQNKQTQETGIVRVPWCTTPLPAKQPLVEGEVAEKLYIHIDLDRPLGQGPKFPPTFKTMLTDAFCRFGSLVELTLLQNKSCAFANYASSESADRAKNTLNQQELGGMAKLKISFASNFKKEREIKREGEKMDTGFDSKRARNANDI